MIRRVFLLVGILIGFTIAAGLGASQGVKMTLQIDKKRYRVGENIKFHITYKNISHRAIWFLPHDEVFPARVFEIKNMRTNKVGAQIHSAAEASIVFEGYAEEVVRLQPGAQTTRTLDADIQSKLPNFYDDRQIGLFLVFPGSSIRLDGSGQYQVRARFKLSPDHPVHAFLPRSKKLWHGEIESNAVVVQISQ
jgi:hypothetical protein